MPEMDGFQVLTALRENSVTSLIPFVLMTALAERESMRSGMELGADDYLTKPFTRDELLKAVNSRLKKSLAVKEHSEQELNKLRKSLAYQLPHELRTPLVGIIGFGTILKEYADSLSLKEIREYGMDIYYSGMRLSHLIENFLLYAQLSIGTFDKTHKMLLEDIEFTTERIAQMRSEKYKRLDDLQVIKSNCTVFSGLTEIEKILTELIDNAFKFSKSGAKVIVECSMQDNCFYFKISDEGMGIAKENLNNIGAFMQFDRILNEQQGSGLGLIISRKLIELLDGTIKIESTLDEGTTVTVTLPAHE